MSLKAFLSATVVALATLALGAAAALVLLTSALHRVTDNMSSALQGVRLAEELQVDLLTHTRLSEVTPPVGSPRAVELAQVEAVIQGRIAEVQRTLTSPEERRLIDEVASTLDAYLASRRADRPSPLRRDEAAIEAPLEEALASLERYVQFNLAEAHNAERQSAHWDGLANLVGFTVAALLVVGVAAVLLWLNRFAFRPALAVSHAMRRFGAGRKRTRAPVEGPAEVRDMAHTFNEMANSLARQQESQLTFLAGIAHDLRNPLSALKMSTALAAPGRGELTPERMQRTLALVRRQVTRLDRMVGDLLDATRIEAGKLELHFEERDARALAREVVELYQSSNTTHELRLVLPEEPVVLRSDAARIEQVLNNLVSNALKYSPSGTRVDVAVAREGEEVVFSVTDQGIGISAEEKRGLFAPFRRTGSAREQAPGVGLGLSVSRRIIEAHGGRIEVDSQPGHGSTFRIRLALVPAQPHRIESQPDASGALH